MAERTGTDILIVSHKLAPNGDNAVCAAHRICSMLLQNEGNYPIFIRLTVSCGELQLLVMCRVSKLVTDCYVVCRNIT